MRSLRFAAAVVISTAFLAVLVLWVYPSSTDFAASNPYWNGLQRAVQEFEMHELPSLDRLPAAAAGTTLVVIPFTPPSTADVEQLRRYLAYGGVLILMDDFGVPEFARAGVWRGTTSVIADPHEIAVVLGGNIILAGLRIHARFSGQALIDPLFNLRSRRLPRILDFTPHPIADRVESLIMNHATVLEKTDGLTVVARSSLVSYLDRNEDGNRSPDEPGGPFPVVAVGRVGQGTLVLVADSSLLLNSMLNFGHNRRLAMNIFSLAGPSPRVYLDEAHLPRRPLDITKLWLYQARRALNGPLLAFALALAALTLPMLSFGRTPRR